LSKIDNIIDFSNIDKHAAEKKNSAFTIDKIFTELESVFSDAVKKNKINTEFKIHFEDNRVFIGDSGKIKKILFHIIENAIKFTQEGSVSVKSRLKDSNEVLVFSVKDSGIGIDHETAVKMYEAFNQGDESYSKRYQGLGLGLSLAKAMTELLNGRIDFESEHGNGTEFTITIPIKTGKSEGCKEQVSSRIPKILVADDNAINVLYLKTMLEKQGFSVLEASNGNEAVSILKTTEVDLILMDISMPELDGPETLSIIRKNAEKKSTPYIPVIAITAFTLNGDRNKFIQMGFDEYIKKPFEKNDILSVIRSFLGETDEE
jgi:CheY-like chemotaxis protein